MVLQLLIPFCFPRASADDEEVAGGGTSNTQGKRRRRDPANLMKL
jgi:hypothetical protein